MGSKKSRKIKTFLWDFLEAIPVISVVVLSSFSIVSIILLLTGSFNHYYILVLGGLISIPMSVYVFRRYKQSEKTGSQYERRFVIICLLLFVAIWVGFNSFFNAKHVFTNRDPATYTIGAKWLKENDNINIKKLKELDNIRGVVSNSAGFGGSRVNGTDLYAQGSHLLPALLAFPARLADSDKLIFNTNLAIGGIALLAVFSLGRIIMRPRWALLVSITLSLTLPMMYFSRDTYTEPLAMAFIFSAMALITMAARQKDNWLWLISGLVLGASAMSRIDAYIPIAAALVFVVIYVTTSQPNDIARKAVSSLIFLSGLLVTSALGFIDVALLSSGYFEDQWHNISMELYLIAVIIAVGVSGFFIAKKTEWIGRLNKLTKSWRGSWAFWIIIATWLVLISRPLWLIVTNGVGDRNHAEYTVNWLLWYVGPVLILIAMLAVAFVSKKILAAKHLHIALTLTILVVMSSALLYLIKPSIYSDQVWASRRQLMIIMPGMILFGFLALGYIYEKANKLPRLIKKSNPKILISVVATLIVVSPLMASLPFLFKASYSQLEAVNVMCEDIPKDSAIILVGVASRESIMPLRSFCGIKAVGFSDSRLENKRKPTKIALAQFHKAAVADGKLPLIGIYDFNVQELLEDDGGLSEIATISYENVEMTRRRPPTEMTQFRVSVLIGVVNSDGSITKLHRP